MKCPECGTDARSGTRFCRNCGEMLPAEETLAMEAPKPAAAPPAPVPASPAPPQLTTPIASALKTGPNSPAQLPTMPMHSAFPGGMTAPEPAKPMAPAPVPPAAPIPATPPAPVQAAPPTVAAAPKPASPPAGALQPTMPAQALALPPMPAPPAKPPAPPAQGGGYGPPLASFAPPPQALGNNFGGPQSAGPPAGYLPPQPVGGPGPGGGYGMNYGTPPMSNSPGLGMNQPAKPPGVMAPGGPAAPRKKSNTGLFVLIGGVAVVGVLMLGLIIVGFVITASRSSAPTEKPPVTASPTTSSKTRGESEIFESYLSKVEMSYMDAAPKDNDDITFYSDRKGTDFPAGIRALVLHVEGTLPSGTDLTAYWSRSGTTVQEQEIGPDLRRGRNLNLNLSIYKPDGTAIGNGSYQVEIRDKNGTVAARIKFFVGE